MSQIKRKGINIVHRDARVIRGKVCQFRKVSSPQRALKFAQLIMGRYADRRWQWPMLDLVFRQSKYGITLKNWHSHIHAHIAPRLELKMLNWLTQRSGKSANRQPLPVLRMERQIPMDILRLKYSGIVESTIIENLARRLITRGNRVETLQEALHASSGQNRFFKIEPDAPSIVSIPVVQPIRKVIRRSIPVKAEFDAFLHSAEGIKGKFQKETKAMGTGQQPTGIQIDINRLTNQVIQAIDRRIIAQRERIGRI